ncbi:MAG: bifunctional demethylmenaquinone methyltransferase/2-methoxy-6-polyprenyl-1,4-benzoquinol methylase UbiE [Glaciecola sp.]|jgi:demethylmenaquinone methyltransferase/2-methoxy-6-polyprenyl-1,4-benzoquinol methylase|nr:bifunctional demethylmenaquinone methyltransferase/2-methoxy-6-polyprenyl-1,4-benzoquinol methylase UbiE [Alteromonas sp. W364]MDT0628736.1 bifunctional demethylmenaquinone methyltransferase/2-methoxy-6-polyprenyl-1,4-benzoquinol methylase UbiE [Alteromonas sp. W364]
MRVFSYTKAIQNSEFSLSKKIADTMVVNDKDTGASSAESSDNLLDQLDQISAEADKPSEIASSSEGEQTHFGFKQVDKQQKESMVADVFHSVAAKYDVMNDLMSLGIHRLWKRYTIDSSGIRPGQKVLDLAGGTGDLAAKFSRIVGETGQVTLADINHSMLMVGKEKLTNMGILSNLNYVQANAEALPFPDNHFDLVTMAFGLRNVTEKSNALASIFRVLKPGGRLLVLEFSKPTSEALSKIYDTYSFHLLPKMGKLVANDSESYQYLAESIRMHPDQETLENMMKEVGFEQTSYTNLTGGIVALHRGFKF